MIRAPYPIEGVNKIWHFLIGHDRKAHFDESLEHRYRRINVALELECDDLRFFVHSKDWIILVLLYRKAGVIELDSPSHRPRFCKRWNTLLAPDSRERTQGFRPITKVVLYGFSKHFIARIALVG